MQERNRNGIKDFIAVVGLTRAELHAEFACTVSRTLQKRDREREEERRRDRKKKETNPGKAKKSSDTELGQETRVRGRARGGAPVERGAHIVLIGNPDSRGVS